MIGLLAALALQTPRYSLPTPPPCGMPFHDVTVLQRVTPSAPPGLTVDRAAHGVAQVSVAPDGSVVSVRVTQSTGVEALDNALLDAARRSTYQAKQDNCTSVPGTYLFNADFGSGQSEGSPQAAPTGSPSPCNHEGRVETAAHVVYPASLRVTQPQTAIVRVTIGTSGALLDEHVVQSTGTAALDQSALDAAKHSTYAPKMTDCKPVEASYLFRFVFNPH